MKRSRFAIVALLVLALIGVGLAGSTATAKKNTIHPKVGHYEGRDSHHRHIRFFYGSHNQILNFRVEHTAFPPAHVQSGKWHHTCHNNHCTRGHWITATDVHGHWNISTQGGDVPFTARWVSH